MFKCLVGLALLFVLISSPGVFAQEGKKAGLEFDVVAAPVEFVRKDKNDYFVTIEKNGKPQKQKVQLGIADDNYYEIKSGLAPGDKIIWTLSK